MMWPMMTRRVLIKVLIRDVINWGPEKRRQNLRKKQKTFELDRLCSKERLRNLSIIYFVLQYLLQLHVCL